MGRSGRPLNVDSELLSINRYVTENDFEQIDYLINKFGVDCFDSHKRTFLIISTLEGNAEVLNYLIDKGADVNFQDNSGYSALHFASQNKFYNLAKILVDKKADINLRDSYGNSPIWTAIFNARGDNSIVKLLLDKGADVITKNNHNKSPKEIWKVMNGTDLETL